MRRRALLVVAVGFLVVLAGCSGSITETAANPVETTTPGDEPTTIATEDTANGTLSVYYLNVGQGASTLIIGPSGETMLVDTGDWRDDGEIIINQLQRLGVDRIDHLVTTHPDADHIGGHAAVIDYLETEGEGVGAVWDPGITSTSKTYENYLDAVEEHDVTLYRTYAGDKIPLDNVSTTVLAPPEGYIANEDSNENSIVLHLQHGETSVLLPGDGEAESEEYLLGTYGSELNSTVLVPGHHGSSSSTSPDFRDTVSPQVAVITSGYDSQYGHPHEEVLQRLSKRSIPTYWTGTHGTIRMQSNGTAITVASQQNAPTDPISLRDGDAIEPGSTSPFKVRSIVHVDGVTSERVLTDGGTSTLTTTTSSSGDGELSVATVHADPDGDDRENLNDEYVVFENTGAGELDISGWTIADEADHTYTVPEETILDAGEQVTLYTGSGTDSETELYWGAESPIWNNAGDTVIVSNADGDIVLEESYDG